MSDLIKNDPVKCELRFSVAAVDANSRVDQLLSAQCGWLSRIGIARMVADGACFVNAKLARAGQRLQAGDEVSFTHNESDISNAMTPEALPLDIIHEDAHLLVIIKPAGMLMHPTRGVKSGTLANALTYHLNHLAAAVMVRPGLVHRLDCATSGLVVVAKTQRALSILSRHFHERRVEKTYMALLAGQVVADEMTISAPIGRDAVAHPKWNVMEDGKAAETHLRVLESRIDKTLVEFTPLTGRTNQLRIHSNHIGHPIIGDEWYGEARAERLCLHAATLAFYHPAGEGWLKFESPMPLAMRQELEKV